jgi:hypothetical protein
VIRKITLKAEGEHISFAQALSSEPETLKAIGGQLSKLSASGAQQLSASSAQQLSAGGDAAVLEWFEHPENYNGLSVKKARELAAKYKKAMEELDV